MGCGGALWGPKGQECGKEIFFVMQDRARME